MEGRLWPSPRRLTLQNSGNSNYNSLQVSAERRARDITYLLSYTYAKSMDDVLRQSRTLAIRVVTMANLVVDMRHNFVASYNWNLPFDRFLGAHRYSQGWQITGISRFNTGFPVSLQGSGDDFALTNIGLDYPNQMAPIQKLNPRAPAHTYFNTSAFASNLSCGFEVCGVTGSAKQFLFHGPGTINTDAGVEKDTKITERMQLNFRIEMFNVFNHANFLTSVRWAMRTAASSVRSPTPLRLVSVRSAASSSSNLNVTRRRSRFVKEYFS